MRGSRNFRQGGGGVQVSLTKKSSGNLTTFFFFFFSPQLILPKSNGQFQRNLSFFKVPEGVQHFPGGGPTFSSGGGGGSNCLFPKETHITCHFPEGGGVRTPCPPSGSALADAIYLLALLTNVIVEASSVGPDQQQSILGLHCLTQMLLKHLAAAKTRRLCCDKRFKD